MTVPLDHPPPEGFLAHWQDPHLMQKLLQRQRERDRERHPELKLVYDWMEEIESTVAEFWEERRRKIEERRREILEILKQRGQKK